MKTLLAALLFLGAVGAVQADGCGWEFPWFTTHQPCFLSTPPILSGRSGGPTPALPDVAGWGALASGGRGGSVCTVTSTADVAPGGSPATGTFRACVNASSARTIVFATGGTITLNAQVQINASRGNLTIAGQTAPGGGIQLRFNNTCDKATATCSGSTTCNYNNAVSPFTGNCCCGRVMRFSGGSNVVISHLRFRSGVGQNGATTESGDNISINRGSDIVFDHCSFEWASDELVSAFADSEIPVERISFHRNIFAEGILGHSNGFLGSGDTDGTTSDWPSRIQRFRYVHGISFDRNLFHTNDSRNPKTNILYLEAVNNLVYNWIDRVLDTQFGTVTDWVNNYLKVGPARTSDGETDSTLRRHLMSAFNTARCIGGSTPGLRCCPTVPQSPPGTCEESVNPTCAGGGVCTEYKPVAIAYSVGTYASSFENPGTDVCDTAAEGKCWYWVDTTFRVDTNPGAIQFSNVKLNYPPIPIPVGDATLVPADVLADVGANRKLNDATCLGGFLPNLDAVDSTLITDATNGGGRTLPPTLAQIVYPTLSAGTACADTDSDGMADLWEAAHGLSVGTNDSQAFPDGTGYTNLEHYLYTIPMPR